MTWILVLCKSSNDDFPLPCPDKTTYLVIIKRYDSGDFGGIEASVDKLVAMAALKWDIMMLNDPIRFWKAQKSSDYIHRRQR